MKKIRRITFVFCLGLFILFSLLVVCNKISWFDEPVYNLLNSLFHEKTTLFFITISNLCSPIVLTVITLSLLILIESKKMAYLSIVNLILSTVGNAALKIMFLRERPSDFPLVTETGYSYPSGHSMVGMAFYGFLIYIVWQTKWSKNIKITLTVLLGLLIFLIGCSRIYLRVHYPSDVFGGFAVAIVYLYTFIHIIKKWSGNDEVMKKEV